MEQIEVLNLVSRGLFVLLGACFFYQIVYLFAPVILRVSPHGPVKQNRYAVLIAARNEEAVLPYLLESIRAQDYPRELVTVYVVADNCTDRTADVASANGAIVYRRFDRGHVGKGYALDYLLQRIEAAGTLDEYDAFLIFDADNLLCPDYITNINRVCSDGYDAFCGFRNSKNYAKNWLSAGSALWYLHDSVHLNASRMLLGNMCAVTGTGFGFTRDLLARCGGWKFFTLTEDIEFNSFCAANGVRIGFARDAMVYDEQPETLRQSWRQRERWVQGGIQVSLRYSGRLLRGLGRRQTAWACFETLTLGLWGALLGVLSFGVSLAWVLAANGIRGALPVLAIGLVQTYGSLFAVGLLTTVSCWKYIGASAAQKIGYCFTFPLFLFTYLPIALGALVRKRQWKPIEHCVAVPVGAMRRSAE